VAGGAANRIVFNTGSGATSFVVAPTASGQVLSWNGSAFAYVAGTISGVALGSNLNSLTAGTYLVGTAYNGSGAQTWTVDATSANTVSKVVARDASGNFSAGTITAALNGNATTSSSTSGNAATATALATTRTLWGQNFNGSANVTGALSSVTTLSMTGQLTNTLAIGTAPLVITSTTRVANLNVATAGTADTLTTARTIGGVSFDGSANINLPGVNTAGNQSTTGNATTATTATNLAGGSAGTVPYQSAAGTTVQLAAGTAGRMLMSNGAAAPSWATVNGGTF
jgi:hypothetical protein